MINLRLTDAQGVVLQAALRKAQKKEALAVLAKIEDQIRGTGSDDEDCDQTPFTDEELDALGEALDLAHGDQQQYLQCGSPEKDYGAEWPETARRKALTFLMLASAGEKMGFHGERERWSALAKSVTDTLEGA